MAYWLLVLRERFTPIVGFRRIFVSELESVPLQTDGQTYRRTDGRTDGRVRFTMRPGVNTNRVHPRIWSGQVTGQIQGNSGGSGYGSRVRFTSTAYFCALSAQTPLLRFVVGLRCARSITCCGFAIGETFHRCNKRSGEN